MKVFSTLLVTEMNKLELLSLAGSIQTEKEVTIKDNEGNERTFDTSDLPIVRSFFKPFTGKTSVSN